MDLLQVEPLVTVSNIIYIFVKQVQITNTKLKFNNNIFMKWLKLSDVLKLCYSK